MIAKDEVRKRSKGYAFIQYSSQEAALQALENMDQKVVISFLHIVHCIILDFPWPKILTILLFSDSMSMAD